MVGMAWFGHWCSGGWAECASKCVFVRLYIMAKARMCNVLCKLATQHGEVIGATADGQNMLAQWCVQNVQAGEGQNVQCAMQASKQACALCKLAWHGEVIGAGADGQKKRGQGGVT